MSKTAAGLAAWVEDAYKKGWVYWYGTCGYKCTTSLLNSKTKQYPQYYTDKRMSKYEKHVAQGKTCTDCIGLIKSYAWDQDEDIDTIDRKYQSNGVPDNGAKTTYNKATIKGLIKTIPEIPGVLVWTKNQGHVGVYVGGGYVVEARGFSYNPPVQRNKLSKRAFTHWGLHPYLEYTAEEIAKAKVALNGSNSSSGESEDEVRETIKEENKTAQKAEQGANTVIVELNTLKNGSKGEQVKTVQRLFNAMGYDCGTVDGIFGTKTKNAAISFQRSCELSADGIIGEKTWNALLK